MELKYILNEVLKRSGNAFFYTPSIYKDAISYLFVNPSTVINYDFDDSYLAPIDEKLESGKIGFAILPYELGYSTEKVLSKLRNEKINSVIHKNTKTFFFDAENVQTFKSHEIDIPPFKKSLRKKVRLNEDFTSYQKKILEIKAHILEGNTYQTNFTMRGDFDFDTEPVDLFTELIYKQSAEFSAFINLGETIIISISPELFFKVEGRKIITRPMKGTIKRGINNSEDSINRYTLQYSEKDKAENIMIVDLLRNDLGKICEYNSITAEKRFQIEKYESVFQMVSEVEGTLKEEIKFSDIMRNLFPCGSVTGAPKIRTMELIHQLENEPRGIYTGAIGIISKNKMAINVAIRTIELDLKNKIGSIGLGSGIVADSKPFHEFNECKLKGNFFSLPFKQFEIIETMLIEERQIFLLKEHLLRLKQTAEYFLFNYDESEIRAKLDLVIEELDDDKKYKLRLMLNKWGNISFTLEELKTLPEEIIVNLSTSRISSKNKFQYFKTTQRKLYDRTMAKNRKSNIFESIFLNERNEVVEGAFTNIFIREGDHLITPPMKTGLLAGVYRNHLLNSIKNVEERFLAVRDLIYADEIILVNSVRKEIKVDKFYFSENEYKEYN